MANEPMEGAWEVVSTTNPQSNGFEYESLAREISNIKIDNLVFLSGLAGGRWRHAHAGRRGVGVREGRRGRGGVREGGRCGGDEVGRECGGGRQGRRGAGVEVGRKGWRDSIAAVSGATSREGRREACWVISDCLVILD